MDLDWYIVLAYRSDLLSGLLLTLEISAAAIFLATIAGVGLGCAAETRSWFLRQLVDLFQQVMRNIPAVVKLFFVHFVVGLDAMTAAILVLSLHQSAYIADVTASGLRSVPKAQKEAGRAMAMSGPQILWLIVMPQALKVVIPPMTTQYTQIVKNSSVVMLIALQDLTFMTQRIAIDTFRGVEAAIVVTVLYLCAVLTVTGAMTAVEAVVAKRYPGLR